VVAFGAGDEAKQRVRRVDDVGVGEPVVGWRG